MNSTYRRTKRSGILTDTRIRLPLWSRPGAKRHLRTASIAAASKGAAAAPVAAELARQVTQHLVIMKAKWVATGIAAGTRR